jgi:uncharacterized membrane protein YeaQ/YmgE (transglycosylase-associated protein family)
MTWLGAIIVGGVIGWLASLIMKTSAQQGVILNILVGIFGSVLGAWFFGDILGISSALSSGEFTLVGLLWAVAGAALLIWLLKLIGLLK